jgi:hypothetical protein
MQLLPYRKLELHSPLATSDVVRVIAAAVEPRRWLRSGARGCPFEGTVSSAGFEIQRIISYRNSFLPQIRGTISAAPTGSSIAVTMQLHVAVVVFISVWLGAVFLASLFSLTVLLSGDASLAALIPLAMLLFGTLVTSGAFAIEASKAEQLLRVLVEATGSAADTRTAPQGS